MSDLTIPKVKIKCKRGFAAMPEEKQRQIASMGGKAAQASGKAHRYNAEKGRVAGKKGGSVIAKKIGYMQMIGRLGGLRSAIQRRRKELGYGEN